MEKTNEKLSKQKKIDRSVGKILNEIVFFRRKLSKKRILPSKINKFLFLKLDAIGDSILSLPVLKEVKTQLHCRVIVVCSLSNKCVFEEQDFIDEVIVFNSKKINKDLFKTLLKIKKVKADICVDSAQSANLSALISYLSSKYSIGFKKTRNISRNKVYDYIVEFNSDKHVILNYFSLVTKVGIIVPEKIHLIPLYYSSDDEKSVSSYFNKKKMVGMSISNEIFSREWLGDRFLEIIKYLIDDDYSVCIFGSKEEAVSNKKILEKLDKKYLEKVVDLSGIFNFRQTFACMKYLSIFIGNDGGMCHVAAAFNIPVLSIFGMDTPKKYIPFEEKSIAIWKPNGLSCCPCTNSVADKKVGCREKYCMQNIFVSDVIDAIKMLKLPKSLYNNKD